MPLQETRIVTYAPDDDDRTGHDYLSRSAVAKRLADLLGFPFGGEYEHREGLSSNVYFVPQHTLLMDQARALGIRGEDDLFGGVVPYPFVATKAITHATVSEHARAPQGWAQHLASDLGDAVLPGYTAFSETDFVNAGRLLLRLGCVRIKPAHHLGGLGQSVATNESELERALATLDKNDLHEHGVVLEQNLSSAITHSIGEVRLRGHRAAYYGLQRTTANARGQEVYGGTDLTLIRGSLADLLELDLPRSVRLAVEQAMRYDRAVMSAFPQFYASRRNYDVVQGRDEQERAVSGVLEQSWRFGGASAAEIRGLNLLDSAPQLRSVQASTHEIYAPEVTVPANADVYFDGDDGHGGRLVKYCVSESYGS